MAVFEGLQHSVSLPITDAINQHENPWEQARAGIAAFLDACTQPAYQTVVLKEGPAAIGWERWREPDTDYYAHPVDAFIDLLAPDGLGDYASAMLAATMRGTLTELSFAIAESHEALARQETLAVIDGLLTSFGVTASNRPNPKPTRIAIGQPRASPGTYLDHVAAGETIDIIRRGTAVARLQQSTSQAGRGIGSTR